MLIDCDSCAMRDIACGDCVMTMLLDRPATDGAARSSNGGPSSSGGIRRPTHRLTSAEFDDDEQRAVDLLAEAGLISPLRLVPLLHSKSSKHGSSRSIA
jgi:hypothetical protein